MFHVLLHAYTGRADSAVGVNTANRERPEFADVLGYFTNSVVHRVQMAPDQSFSALLSSVTETLLEGLEHGGVTLENLLGPVGAARDRGRAPLVEVGFGQNTAHDPALSGVGALLSADRDGVRVPLGPLTLETVALRRTGAVYDLAGVVFEGDDSISITWEYDADLFTEAAVNRLATRFEVMVDTLLSAPDAELGTLSALALPPDQQPAAAAPWNRSPTSYGGGPPRPLRLRRSSRARTRQPMAHSTGPRTWWRPRSPRAPTSASARQPWWPWWPYGQVTWPPPAWGYCARAWSALP